MESFPTSLWDLPIHENDDSSPSSPAPDSIHLCALFSSFSTMQDEIRAARAKLAAAEREIFGATIDCKNTLCEEDYAEAAVKAIFSRARERYAANGTVLVIDQEAEMKSLRLSYWKDDYRTRWRKRPNVDLHAQTPRIQPIDLQRISDHLEIKFGNGAGVRLAHQQQASIISKYFRLENMEFKESSFGVVISKSNYLSTDKWNGVKRYEIHQSDKSTWCRELLQAFIAFARYVDAPLFESEIAQLAEAVSSSGKLSMPCTWSYTQVRLKIFTERMDLTLHRSVAEKLQLYLGEFFIPKEY